MPRPKVTVDDVPVEQYYSGAVICETFGFGAVYLSKLKREPGFPYLPLPGGEARYRISELEEWFRAHGRDGEGKRHAAQAARAKVARAAIGKNGKR